jgi:hypothetical protein
MCAVSEYGRPAVPVVQLFHQCHKLPYSLLMHYILARRILQTTGTGLKETCIHVFFFTIPKSGMANLAAFLMESTVVQL